MNNENKKLNQLAEEIGNIDEDMLQEALNYENKKKILPLGKILSIAAILTITLGIGICIKFANQNPSGIISENVVDNSATSFESQFSEDVEHSAEIFQSQNESFDSSEISSENVSEESSPNESSSENQSNDINSSSEENTEDTSTSDEASQEIASEDTSDSQHGNLPPLEDVVEINDLNKLAYYSGWTTLKNYGIYTQKSMSSITSSSGFIPLSNTAEIKENSNFADLSEIPEDILAYAIQKLTVSEVEYFKVDIEEKCFITNQVLTGTIETMILSVSFDGITPETMIIFKNKNRFFSCLLDTYEKQENGDRIFTFSPTKIVCDFNIVCEPELSDYSFIVTFVGTEGIPQIKFSYKERGKEATYTINVPKHTYNAAKNVTVSNTISSLNDALYKIYVEETSREDDFIPEKPNLPQISERPATLPETEGEGEYIRPEILTRSEPTNFKEVFGTDAGYAIVTKGTEGYDLLKMAYHEEDLFTYMDYYPEGAAFVVAWVKGYAHFSKENFYVNDNKITGFLEYSIMVENEADRYTVKLYCFLQKTGSIESVEILEFKNAVYAVSHPVSFTTENEYDSLEMFGIENEDEFELTLFPNGKYEIYKGGEKVYINSYKVAQGFILYYAKDHFHDEDYAFAQELSRENTFVYELYGWKRVFMLKQ